MAITKIWTVKSRLDSSLNYIANPDKTSIKPDIDAVEGVIKYIKNEDKTENCLYVKAYNCTTDNPYADMIDTQEFFGKAGHKNAVLAYHLVQSFKDFETMPEVAHKCGLELAERLFADKYEVVVATHLDHAHLHNHLIINSVSYVDGYKYRNNFKDYFIDIRGISDAICIENCLSVIKNPQRRGMHYAEWLALKEGRPTIRGSIRRDIDEIIKCSYTMEQFWQNLKKRGFVIHRKGTNIKYTSIIAPNAKRPMRLDNLGNGYSEVEILERIIATRNGIITAAPSEMPKKQYKFRGNIKNVKGKKLKGFVALYFHYLYLFKKIQRKQTPQRVSFFMRDEMIKFDRYQKQFKFLFSHGIETGEDLQKYQKDKEAEVEILITRRKKLYEERTDESCDEVKDQAKEINTELNELRKEIRLCKAIFKDSYKIAEKKRQALALQKQADKELRENEHKRRSR
ncbi:MAG: relaxase/mobilization nuclease domain-containing protein [Clostridia bacterium]|nr:relaxase/mobilization nuclease domain-containing protein [Clostridia bacterium]